MNKVRNGFKNADGSYYGPYMPGQEPAGAQPVNIPANTPEKKAANGWFTPEMKNQLFGTILNLGSSAVNNKINGGNTASPDSTGMGDKAADDGPSVLKIALIGVASIAAIGGLVWAIKKYS